MSDARSHVLATRFDPPLNPDIEATAILPFEAPAGRPDTGVCLARETPRHRLHHWQLVNLAAHQPEEHTGIIGAVLQVPQGSTSPIAAFDPVSRRVRTTSGSVYELGIPARAFALAAPALLTHMGFPAATIQALRGQAES